MYCRCICFVIIMFISCKTKQEIVEPITTYSCDIIRLPNDYDLKEMYKDFEKDTFFATEFSQFERIRNGLLHYQYTSGFEHGTFFTIDFDADFLAKLKWENSEKRVNISKDDKKNILSLFRSLEKESYFQECKLVENHTKLDILILKKENEIVIHYFSPFGNLFSVPSNNSNFQKTDKIFKIAARNVYR